ncbi:right-handed parallel beta-helix repeat-containing protein [Paenibacillus sp.]|uniref:right-handed parallel beta-helix repeat-containing protein n=1 Tax=Paenibacillus sp. TaxID=58172 RepID=UPI002811D1DB|nr:right-handed parallel beta-helix repeat-containing protein [Paenibacillus sp.]
MDDTLHLAPGGRDDADGSAAAPLRTLQGAAARIRELRRDGRETGAIEVLLHGGEYSTPEGLLLTGDDLGDEDRPVVFRAAGDGEAVVTGGIRLKGFEPQEGGIVRLDLAAAGHAGLRFSQLLYRGEKQRIARYPSFQADNPYGGGWLYVEGDPVDMYEGGHGQKDRFVCRDPRLQSWSALDRVELFIFPRFNWNNDMIPLSGYDPATGEVLLSRPATYEIYPGDRFYFRNVREELTEPGEWYLDKDADMLYFYPPAPVACEDVEVYVPTAAHLIELRGAPEQTEDLYTEKIDWRESGTYIHHAERMPQRVGRGYVSFEGLTLEGCAGTAALLRDVSECRLSRCIVRYTGAAGVTVLGGKRNVVADCDIYETGSHGMYVSGGVRSPFAGRYDPCGHEATNNYVHHIGTETKSVAGISINGVGIRVANNLIHDGPRWGIQSRGNRNVIEYNHIRHVNVETSDTAAIYLVDRDWTMFGTKIRYNRIHDILGYHAENGVWMSPSFAFGIYLDDYTSGVEVYGNVTYRTPGGGLYLHAGKENKVENNMFLDTSKEVAKFRRWREEKEYETLRTRGLGLRHNEVRRNIFASGGAQAVLYRFDTALDKDGRLDLDTNVWENNLVWLYGKPATVRVTNREEERFLPFASWQSLGYERGSVEADPRFDAAGPEPHALLPDSPAFALGFEPLPFESMGLRRDVHEAPGVREHPVRTFANKE